MPLPRSHTVILVLAAAVSATTLAGCGFVNAGDKSSVKPSGFVISGHAAVPVSSGGTATPGASCTAPAGASDIVGGATVTVTSPAGTKIATGQLDNGFVTIDGATCSFQFQIRAVAGGYATYGVAIGTRPAETFPAGPLQANLPAILTITPTP